MGKLKETTDWLRASAHGATLATDGEPSVDRNAGVIHGMIIAQEGPFKSEGRGEFDRKGLRAIVKLMKAAPNGLKSRFAHPSLSDDGLGKFLGRVKNPRMDTITTRDSEGTRKDDEISVVRGDLHIDPSSRDAPDGDLGGYIMHLAESYPDALSSSLVLQADQEVRLDSKGRPKRDAEDNELPPLWRPLSLHASDVVDTGDAVDGFLSAETIDGLPDAVVRRACELLDTQFGDADRATITTRCQAWLGRYLNHRFGEEEPRTKIPFEDLPVLSEPINVEIPLDDRRLRLLHVTPECFVELCKWRDGDKLRITGNTLPGDTILKASNYDIDRGVVVLKIHSLEFGSVIEGGVIPAITGPSFGPEADISGCKCDKDGYITALLEEPPEYDAARDPVKAQIRRRREGQSESEGN